jgi:hypothetical protein
MVACLPALAPKPDAPNVGADEDRLEGEKKRENGPSGRIQPKGIWPRPGAHRWEGGGVEEGSRERRRLDGDNGELQRTRESGGCETAKMLLHRERIYVAGHRVNDSLDVH